VNPIRGYTGGYDAFVAKLHFSGSGLALVYSTYLGGSGDDSARGEGAIAVDASGNAYVVGTTTSSDFPTTAGSIQQAFGGGSFDVFVAKLNASGSGLLYSTFLRANDDDHAWSIAVDGSGSAYVAGYTGSSNFPTVNPIQSYKGGRDAFVAKLNPVGGALVYSTYLGGSGFDQATRVAIDGSGAAYVVGETTSADFPTVNQFQSLKGTQDAFIARLDSSGGALTFSTYLGGTEGESSFGLALDSSGNAYVLGSTKSADYPTTPNAFQQVFRGGVVDAFVAKISFDNIPPVISGLPAAGCTLWPPNHKLVQVATVMAADSGSGVATFQVTGASNEPSDPKDPDIVITGSGSQPRIVQLRADRLGGGTGRVYTLTATATDQAGNTTTSTATCVVPHDQGN